jgi:hypothetical protein
VRTHEKYSNWKQHDAGKRDKTKLCTNDPWQHDGSWWKEQLDKAH